MDPMVIILTVLLTGLIVGTIVYLAVGRKKPVKEVVYTDKPKPPPASETIVGEPEEPQKVAHYDARIIIRDEKGFQREINLSTLFNPEDGHTKPVLIGRDEDCQIRLTEGSVSRNHAKLRLNVEKVKAGSSAIKYEFSISDLDSENHTYINNKKIDQRVILQDGDIIKVGKVVEMRFVFTQYSPI